MSYRRKPRNRDKHRAWQKMYTVEHISERTYTTFAGLRIPSRQENTFFVIRDRQTNEIIGKYNDYKYATQQAWYKYKRQLKKVERLLLVEDV